MRSRLCSAATMRATTQRTTCRADTMPERWSEPLDDLYHVRPTRWDTATTRGEFEVVIDFTGDGTDNGGLARVDIDARPECVEITLYTGYPSETGPYFLGGVSHRTLVRLSEPLAGRPVVDGAPAPADPFADW